MSRITEEKEIYKHRSEKEMRNALQALLDHQETIHIPPDDDDTDIILSDAINELLKARNLLLDWMHTDQPKKEE